MENPTPFDLNEAIRRWRENLGASPALSVDNLEELASHLRASVQQLQADGLSEEEAFLAATRRLGERGALEREFAKVDMKRWPLIVAVALFMIFAVADFMHDFITSAPVHYYAQQPARLLWVAAIAIGVGLITLAFCQLSPRWQQRVKLLASVAAAVCLTALAGYFVHVFVWWSSWSGIANIPVFIIAAPLWLGGGAAFLWFVFYRLTKSRIQTGAGGGASLSGSVRPPPTRP
jgi:hypothetical protein